ncbi:hypothetical protein [Nannocystis punicea]|uniref:Uncharacterized protein n=1 Tax=Nannocystis punicea TaxID=2995304 RepID=A0ABY7HIV9_9BACT|nr:hypothetical protein [Nannocystis poenicansa]WAS99270.1 hypothetical protein O0S08_24340 [Nannocystis poenicansa]
MGLFDFRCPVSGLSLRAADAVHVALIEVSPGEWSPLSLPLRGCYDRGGSIDGFTPDFRTELFVAGFARFVQAKRVEAGWARDELASFVRRPGIESLLYLFERVNTMSEWGEATFTLDGRSLRQVLIHAQVFTAVAPPVRPAQAPEYEALEQQLARAPVAPQAREMFEEIIIAADPVRVEASAALSQLTAFTRWLAAHQRRWSPAAETGQFGVLEDLEFAREALVKLDGSPKLLRVIERVLEELEEEARE